MDLIFLVLPPKFDNILCLVLFKVPVEIFQFMYPQQRSINVHFSE